MGLIYQARYAVSMPEDSGYLREFEVEAENIPRGEILRFQAMCAGKEKSC